MWLQRKRQKNINASRRIAFLGRPNLRLGEHALGAHNAQRALMPMYRPIRWISSAVLRAITAAGFITCESTFVAQKEYSRP
jgi:hypothetical protein